MRFLSRLIPIALCPALASSDPLPTNDGPVSYYAVERADESLVIDGNLDEFSWEKAIQINNLERMLNDYDQVLFPTRAKMLWDREYFYFAFVCQDADMWAIYENEDDHLWEEEVVEIFIDPDGDGKNYLELEINPHNQIVDLLIYAVTPEWHSSIDWDIAGLKTAVQAHGTVNDSLAQDEGWTAEIAIPWAAIADSVTGGTRPVPGDIWRLNLYRIERKGGRNLKSQIDALQTQAAPIRAQLDSLSNISEDKSLLDAPNRQALEALNQQLAHIEDALAPLQAHYRQETEFTAWNETYMRGFHHPDRFGAVQFTH